MHRGIDKTRRELSRALILASHQGQYLLSGNQIFCVALYSELILIDMNIVC